MNPLGRFALPSILLLAPLTACSAAAGNAEESSAAVSECAQVRSTPTRTQETDDSGKAVTSLTVDATGCIATDGAAGSGSKLVDALVTLIEDDTKLAAVSGAKGKVFSRYSAQRPTGRIDGPDGLSRTIDVTFNASKSPSTTLKVTLKKSSTGELSFQLVNTKGIGVLFFTAVAAGGLDVNLKAKPTPTSVTISGQTKVVVQAGYEDSVTGMDELPSLVIHWLKDQIAHQG